MPNDDDMNMKTVNDLVQTLTPKNIVQIMNLSPSKRNHMFEEISNNFQLDYDQRIRLELLIKRRYQTDQFQVTNSNHLIEEPSTVQ